MSMQCCAGAVPISVPFSTQPTTTPQASAPISGPQGGGPTFSPVAPNQPQPAPFSPVAPSQPQPVPQVTTPTAAPNFSTAQGGGGSAVIGAQTGAASVQPSITGGGPTTAVFSGGATAGATPIAVAPWSQPGGQVLTGADGGIVFGVGG